MNYAERIRKGREAAGLTQAELANNLKIKSASIADWEKGKTEPNLLQVPLLCFALNMGYDTFFGLPARRGKQHRRKELPDAYQTTWLPVMYRYVIQYYREKQGMTMQKLAEQCAVKTEVAEKWELGKAIPKLDEIPLICSALKIRIWQFFE